MTTEQTALKRLKEVCEKATPGPWKLDLRDYKIIGESERPVARLVWEWTIGNKDLKNACFIATARTALPALIELCEAYEAEMTDYWHGKVMNNDRSKAARARLEDVCPTK